MATATFTEVVDRSVGDPLTEAIWDDQIKDNVNQLAGAHRNLLTNGGFEVWQRGAGAFTANNAYTADRWQLLVGSLSSDSVTQESTTIDSQGRYSLACAHTHSSASFITQKIEHWHDLRGKTVCFSVRVRQSAASMVRLRLGDGVSPTAGSTTTTTGSFVTLTHTLAVSASATELVATIDFLASGTAYLDNAMLVVGPAPAPYRPLHPQEELARCQRYYEVHGGGTLMHMAGYQAASNPSRFFIPFAVPKGGAPTVTKNGTWNVSNCSQPSIVTSNVAGYSIGVTVTALGAFSFNGDSTDDTVTAEWNP